jgi:polar amino acid transport system substrate-binding protein
VERETRLWSLIVLVVGLVAAFAVAGCGDDDSTSGDSTGAAGDVETITAGTLTVGTDTPYPPFEIGQPPDISGFDIDLVKAIAEEIGLTPEFTDTSFDTIFRDTANGQFDLAAAASTITPAREKVVTFSDPYYEAQQALVVVEGSDIASTEDLSGAVVGAQDATTGETYANDETDAAEVRGFPEGPDAIAAVATEQVDAAIIDLPVAVEAVEKQGGIEVVEEIPTEEFYGFAMPQDNTSLHDAVNGALATLAENGTLTDLYQQYFQTDPPESILKGLGQGGGQRQGGGE